MDETQDNFPPPPEGIEDTPVAPETQVADAEARIDISLDETGDLDIVPAEPIPNRQPLAEFPEEVPLEPIPAAVVSTPEPEYDAKPRFEPETSSTTTQTEPTTEPLKGEWNDEAVSMALPAHSLGRLNAMFQTYPRFEPKSDAWISNLRNSNVNTPDRNLWNDRVIRAGSDWRQSIKGADNRDIKAVKPVWNAPSGAKLTGQEAVLRIREVVGVGSIVQIPCWASGFYLTLRAPAEADLLALEHRIIEEKVDMGRMSNGAVFSNMSVFLANHMMNFVAEHLYDTTLKNRQDLDQKLVMHDLQTICWGMALAIYPNGFQYARSVFREREGGQEPEAVLLREKLRLSKLYWVDHSMLSEWQIRHMSNRAGSTMTDEDILRYRKEFKFSTGRETQLLPNLKMRLKLPTIREYIEGGIAWVNGLVLTAEKALGMRAETNERNEYVTDQARSSHLLQYVHFFECLIDDRDNIIEEPDTLRQTLAEIGGNEEVVEIIYREVNRFIEDTTVSIIATPTVDASEEQTYPRHPLLLPLDAMSTFFTLLNQNVAKIRSR